MLGVNVRPKKGCIFKHFAQWMVLQNSFSYVRSKPVFNGSIHDKLEKNCQILSNRVFNVNQACTDIEPQSRQRNVLHTL